MKERIRAHLPGDFRPVAGAVFDLSRRVIDEETGEVLAEEASTKLVVVGWMQNGCTIPAGYIFDLEDGVFVRAPMIRRDVSRPTNGGRCDKVWAVDQSLELIERLNPKHHCRPVEEVLF